MGGKGRLQDEPHPLGDVWNALEGLHPVGDILRAGGPQPDVDQPRLMEEIREKRGLTYGVGTALATGLYGQTWQGGMSGSNATTAEAVELIRAEWARMAEGVTDQELTDAKTYLTGEYPLRWDGNAKIAAILAGMQLIGLPVDYPDTRNARIEAVTAEDVARVAAERLSADKLHLVLVGRPEGFNP